MLGDAPDAYHALGWLHARGRRARLAPAPPADADPNARYRLWAPNEWLQEVLSAPALYLQHVREAPSVWSAEAELPHAEAPASALQITRLRACADRRATAAEFQQLTEASLQHWRALDLGCGSGREAVFLASLGVQVVAVDRLPEALERGRDLQYRYVSDSPPIQWVCADLEHADWRPDGAFDCITLFYFLSRALIPRACAWLNPNGSLLIEAFTPTHRARYGKPAADARVVGTNELPRLLPPAMRVVAYSEGWRANGRHTARLWAVRMEE